MEFFKELAQLGLMGDLILTITPLNDGKITVMTYLNNKQVTDPAARQIPPNVITATPEEFDADYLTCIAALFPATSGLFSNMIDYQKKLEQARLQTAQAKDETIALKRQKEEAKKAFDVLMGKVLELEKERKFREAFGKLPDPEQFPDQAQAISDKKKELTAKFSTLYLFDPIATEPKSV